MLGILVVKQNFIDIAACVKHDPQMLSKVSKSAMYSVIEEMHSECNDEN